MRNKFLIGIVLFLLLFSIYPLLHSGVWNSHDWEEHVIRIALYTKEISDGQLLVRWSGISNYSFGSPLFIFFYPLPYYLGTFIHLFGFSLETVFKVVIGIGFVGSFFTFYLWMSQLIPKRNALVASFVYLFGTYHLLDMYVRGDIGEIMAFAILPLILWGIERALQKNSIQWSIASGIFYALLILAHNGISLMFSPIILIYSFLHIYTNKRRIWYVFSLFPVGLLLTLFFWLPALYEQKYILQNVLFENMYLQHFTSIASLLFSSWGFGADVNKPGGLSPQIGAIEWLSFAIASFLIIKGGTRKKNLLVFGVGVFLAGIFLSLSWSTILYVHISLLRKFQFPWRFLAYPYVASAVLTGVVLENIKSEVLVIIYVLGIFGLLPFVVVNGYTHHPDSYYVKSSPKFTSFHGEAIPRWTSGNQGAYPRSHIELIGGKGKIQQIKRISTVHTYTIDGETNLSILDNTVYFPGWDVLVDGKRTPIEFQDMNHRGMITFNVPPGNHIVEVMFHETTDRVIADCISVATVIAIIGVFGIQFLRRKR